jgi:hypothetical protein
MAIDQRQATSFEDSDDRRDAMADTIESWAEDLTDLVEKATASEQFREWLDVQSRFHDYSHRNTLLIKQQCPEATKVAGYRAWQEEFDRHVCEGESAIWIWAPIVTTRCPECENSPSYHDRIDCEYDETPPDEWSSGLVGFRPAPVFDISQTEGEPLPELNTAATGEADDLLPALLETGDEFDVDVAIVDPADWDHGDARGICTMASDRQWIELLDRDNEADLAVTLIHELAHAELHIGVADDTERAKREVEAEAVGYVVGRHFGLDTSGSAFYLATWQGEEPDVIMDRLQRISSTAESIITATTDHV